MKRSPMPARSKPMQRSVPKSKAKARKAPTRRPANEFPEEARQAMRRRSGGICEAGTRSCDGKAAQFHHRKLRRHKDQRPVNGLHVCDDCHLEIHGNPNVSYMMGWLVHAWADPAMMPVKRGDRYAEFHRG